MIPIDAKPVEASAGSMRCPYCREGVQATASCPDCRAGVHAECAWELGRCGACGSVGVLDLLTKQRPLCGWTVGERWATHTYVDPNALANEPRLRLTLDPHTLGGSWIGGQLSLLLPRAERLRALTLTVSGGVALRLRLLQTGRYGRGLWTFSFRARLDDASGDVTVQVHAGLGRFLRRCQLQAGLVVRAGSSAMP